MKIIDFERVQRALNEIDYVLQYTDSNVLQQQLTIDDLLEHAATVTPQHGINASLTSVNMSSNPLIAGDNNV